MLGKRSVQVFLLMYLFPAAVAVIGTMVVGIWCSQESQTAVGFDATFDRVRQQADRGQVSRKQMQDLHAFLDPRLAKSLKEAVVLDQRVERVSEAVVEAGSVEWLMAFREIRLDTLGVFQLEASWGFVARYPDRFFEAPGMQYADFSGELANPHLGIGTHTEVRKCLAVIEDYVKRSTNDAARARAREWGKSLRGALRDFPEAQGDNTGRQEQR